MVSSQRLWEKCSWKEKKSPFAIIRKQKNTVSYKPVIETQEDWDRLKEHAQKELELYYTDEIIENTYGPLKEGHDRGDYSIRLNVEGFFWVPRELMGIEAHMFAFYDEPELLHDIISYILEIYQTKLMKVIRLIQPDVVYFMEDLSGKNGPMISPDCFEEFMGDYYRQIIPMMKEAGVGNVFVDKFQFSNQKAMYTNPAYMAHF